MEQFPLALGATVTVLCLMLGMWITRYFAYHIWTNYPINIVLPAILLPCALVLDAIQLLSRSFLVTAFAGGMLFGLLFYPANWPMLGMYHVPVDHGGTLMTLADLYGFQYLRPGVPEYMRIIERGTLRTYGTYAAPLTAFCAGILCFVMYMAWAWLGKVFSTTRFIKHL